MTSIKKQEKAYLAAGCFWGVEHILKTIHGVIQTEVGYMGGDPQKKSYRDVCQGETGHAEVVEVIFDPLILSYFQLLDYFWRLHDPTTLNQQGPDRGTQYRSAIFFVNEEQKRIAVASKKKVEESGVFERSVVTDICLMGEFFRAEDYHQDYFEHNLGQSCHFLRKK